MFSWGSSSNNAAGGGKKAPAKEGVDNAGAPDAGSAAGGSSSADGSDPADPANPYRHHDEPEVDYDTGATALYKLIENKNWDAATSRCESAPGEAKTWVYRREGGKKNNRSQQQGGGGGVRWRLLPLHATCVFRSPLSLIEALIAAYPDGPQMKDDQGMLPVHLACRNGASKGVVLTLLNAFPESISVKDRKGREPQAFVEQSTSQNREAVLVAMKKFREEQESGKNSGAVVGGGVFGANNGSGVNRTVATANEVDYEHRTVLFRLILKKDWTSAVQRSDKIPDEAATWIVTKGFNGNLRFLPIHKACVLSPPTTVIESLVKANPEGAKSRDQDGWLPLHCACFYGASEGIVDALLAANPKGAQSKDDEGRLPLHYSCLKGSSAGVVSSLLGAFSKGAMSKDDEGRLALHHACSKGACEGVVESLLKANPKAAQSKDDQGRLPLHHCCRKNATDRVVKMLLKVYPRGAQVKDDQDKLGIHYACQNGSSEGVVSALLATYPESINVKNGFGYTPLAESKAGVVGTETSPVIAILEKFKAEQDKIKADNDGAGGDGAGSSSSAAEVVQLRERVGALESALGGIAGAAAELLADVDKKKKSGKELSGPVKNFAEKLVEVVDGVGNCNKENGKR